MGALFLFCFGIYNELGWVVGHLDEQRSTSLFAFFSPKTVLDDASNW